MLWMWGAAVRFFEGRAIQYDVCFSPRDQQHLLLSRSIFQVSTAQFLGVKAHV